MNGVRRIIFVALLVVSGQSVAEKPVKASPSGSSTQEFTDPLKVKGQTRRLNMLLNLKGRDDIELIRPRKSYRKEILGTRY